MAKRASSSASVATNATTTVAATSALAATAATLASTATATPTAKVPASHAVLASIKASPVAAHALPPTWAAYASYTVAITPAGLASRAVANRTAPTAKGGPCPFLVALLAASGNGQTLGQCWPNNAGHGQQGRGAGGYSASQAISYYVASPTGKAGGQAWFKLVPPTA